ncbi:unnamed protein product, partial [Rotaria socialis]
GIMCDHYKHSRAASSSFMMNEKYRTLLRMNDKERPVIYVRVSAANFDGLRVIFGDYKIDDAPLLVINCLKNDSVSFSPINNVRTKILPPQNYVYHAWLDSSKSKELVISCGLKKTKLELTILQERKYAKSDTYIAHITCSENPPSWLMATSKRLLFGTKISLFDLYKIDWQIEYENLKEEPAIKPNLNEI